MSDGKTSGPSSFGGSVWEPGIGASTMYREENQIISGKIRIAGIFFIFCFLFVTGTCAAGTKTAYLGDMVMLSGSSPGSDTVYLFMTGPNLPVNGVALNNINRRADMGGFTTTDVDPDGHWEYKWYTNQLGGKIDTGTYTIWVTDRPVDRSHLSESDYKSISVTLQQPGISAVSSTATGSLEVRTVPEKAVLYLNGDNKGVTPVTITDVPVGDQVLLLSYPGYQNLTTRVVVQEGAITEVSISLSAATGSLSVNTTPPGAEIFFDGTRRGLSPVVLSGLAPGNHTLETRKAGYNASIQEIQIIGGNIVVKQLSLGEEIPSHGPTSSPTSAAGILPETIVLSLFAFLMIGCRPK
jgi:hypothetical protein